MADRSKCIGDGNGCLAVLFEMHPNCLGGQPGFLPAKVILCN